MPAPRHIDRVVTLASLSNQVPQELIATQLANKLHGETRKRILVVQLSPSQGHFSLEDWAEMQFQVNGEFVGNGDMDCLGEDVFRLVLHLKAGTLAPSRFLSLVDHCKQHFYYVLFQIGPDLALPVMLDCLSHSDCTFLFLQPTAKDLYQRDLFFREVRAQDKVEGLNLKTIICREKGEEHFNDLLHKVDVSVHGYIHGCPSGRVASRLRVWQDRHFGDDIRRIAREIGRCRVGLALSSGGARGLSHIGVIQVLEEHGIEVDVIAGCSMGSYVGAIWAYGYDGVFMEKKAREVERPFGLFELIDPFLLPRRGFMRGEKVKRRLQRSIGDVHFSELVRPFRVVATNLLTLERIIFSSGEVAAAVHASSAIPGACAPVMIDGEQYIDGGICDPLPVEVLQDMGIERVIAVNTIPTPAYLRCGEEMQREQAEVSHKPPAPIRDFLNRHFNYFAPGNILDTIFRSFHGAQIRVAEQSCAQADLVLRPLCFDGRWHDFRHPGKYIAIGRREAEEHIDDIKNLVNRKDPAHENKAADNPMVTIT